MPTDYIILRNEKPVDEYADVYSIDAWSKEEGGLSYLSVQKVSGHEKDAGELREDPRNVAVMDSNVIFSLIEPHSQNVFTPDLLEATGTQKMPKGLIAVNAHKSKYTGQGVTVAVLDTGIDDKHPAFKGKQIAMRDFTGEGSSPTDVFDKNGHGTHCAGTVCGAVVDGIRIGVAPGVTNLCIGKVLGKKGGTLEMFLKGMFWAVIDEKASIVSMSLGYDLARNTERLIKKMGVNPALAAQAALDQHSDIIHGIQTLRAFLKTQDKNVLFVAATGNSSKRNKHPKEVINASLPAAELFSVGAVGWVDPKWEVASFSNSRAQIVAPGVDVVSAKTGGGWVTMSGTSMATPHVAGVAALWMEKLIPTGNLNIPNTLISELRTSAAKIVLLDKDVGSIGVGMVQAP